MVKNTFSTDPISEMLTNIRNASAVSIEVVDVPFSRLKYEIAKILERKSFVEKVKQKKKKEGMIIEISLKYDQKAPAISGIKRVSKPGQRIYRKYSEIRRVKGGYGVAIVSTSKGLITDEEAKRQKVGGEIIAEIW
ncbi:30S ribosomal protein S8 [Candidatus Parcubacteria bacterium A4]|nr:MAG: 30S ribosomal protein S8 [Candidatus Parcubacteria bacterium A4]